MNKVIVLTCCILTAATSQAWEYALPEFSPAECRAHGVAVPENYVIEGQPLVIVKGDANAPYRTLYHVDPVDWMCPPPNACGDSCARYLGFRPHIPDPKVWPNDDIEQWAIAYRSQSGYVHAKCHAEYQVPDHTPGW